MVRDYSCTTIGKNMEKPNTNITVYFQAHQNVVAVEEALRRFRKHFPYTKIYFHGDNGYDFSNLSSKYECEYKHWNISIPPRGLAGGNWREYLKRILITCERFPNDWLLLFEEDVNTLHSKLILPNSDFAGIKGQPFFAGFKNYVKKIHPHLETIKYNLCGAGIIKMEAIVNSINNCLNNNINLDEIIHLDNRIAIYSDVLLSAILLLNGYTYGEWDQLSESASKIYKENPAFDHSWKEFYNKEDWEKFINY
jgi:hypothetical protein